MRAFLPAFERIWHSFSGEAAWQTVADLSRLHRIQASPGHRQAAELLKQCLGSAGLAAEVLSYPANEQARFWAWPSFQEWECAGARLLLLEPQSAAQVLADFRACPISLIQRSASFDGELELVLLEDGEEESDYDGLDVAGKIVLTRGDLRRVLDLAVQRRGAVGVLFDGMREVPPVRLEGHLDDVRQYTSFWWRPGEQRCFGFVLTPRQGRTLRRLLRQEGTPVRVHAQVSSRHYDGAIEVLSATLQGQTQQAVLVVAHLCHPQPSANDNASGAAAALEAARTLHALIDRGELAAPRRTIRFLWLPEMTGSAAFLSDHEAGLPEILAGLNLDMVGEDQVQTGSSWLIERPPEAAASFAPELLASLREAMLGLTGMADVSPSHTGLGEYPLYRLAEAPFSGGSDHYILSDPSVGVPTPMLIQWPDRFYHTSADTPDRTDPRSLARSGALAAGYAYWLAAAGVQEVTGLAYEMVARFKAELVRAAQSAADRALAADGGLAPEKALSDLDRKLAFRVDRQKTALKTLERLAPVECLVTDLQAEVERAAQHELVWAGGALGLARAAALQAPGTIAQAGPGQDSQVGSIENEEPAAGLVPSRLVRGPVPLSDYLHALDSAQQDAWRTLTKERKGPSPSTLTTLAMYWADGKRTVLEIADLVELEAGKRDVELLLAYFRILEELGFVALKG